MKVCKLWLFALLDANFLLHAFPTQALITGPEGTPYSNAPLIFDIFLRGSEAIAFPCLILALKSGAIHCSIQLQ
jgi:hypothetical protein